MTRRLHAVAIMSDELDVVAEVFYALAYHVGTGEYECNLDRRDLPQRATGWAKDFWEERPDTDWEREDFIDIASSWAFRQLVRNGYLTPVIKLGPFARGFMGRE